MKKVVEVAKDKRVFDFLNLLHIAINRYNHKIANKNLRKYPQLAIFSFDHIGLVINQEGRYENRVLRLVRGYLESVDSGLNNSVAMDVGANIGNHSIYFSDIFQEVFAFEPNPRTFDLLKINSRYSSLKENIKCFNFGLSEKDAELLFEASRSNVGGSHIISGEKQEKNSGNILIEVKRADDLMELSEKKISLIKIDVEGHELAVLKGAGGLIKRNKPIILFEQNAEDFVDGKSGVVDYLSELNYKFITIEKSFYFGESFSLSLAGLLLRSLFGCQLKLVERDYFKQRFYEMIIAVPKPGA